MIVITAVFILTVGFVPAWAIANRSLVAVPLSGATSGLLCSLAAMSALASGSPFLPWVALWAAGAAAAGIWWLRRSGAATEALTEPAPQRPAATSPMAAAVDGIGSARTGVSLLIVAGLAAPLLIGLRAAPSAWDARSIWFFHGLWFQAGGAEAASAMTNPAFAFSHADYPPLAPATNAALWSVYRGGDRWVAMTVNVWLTVSAAMMVALLVSTIARRHAQPACAAVGGVLVLALFGTTNATALTGLVDLLWAAWVIAAAVALLVLAENPSNRLIGTTCLAAAGVTKAEGFAMGLLVLIGVAVRYRHHLHRLALPMVGLGPALAWSALAASVGATGASAFSLGGISGLLAGDPARLERVMPTAKALGGQLFPLSFLCLGAMALMGLCCVGHRSRLGVGSAGWLLGLSAAGLGIFAVIYVTGMFELTWWLTTSVDRTTIAVRALILTELAIWLVVGLDRVLCGGHAGVPASGPDPTPATATEPVGPASTSRG